MIGKAIRERREKLKLTVTKLAGRCDVAASTISRIENEKQIPRQDLLALICAHLGMGRRQAKRLEAHAMRLAGQTGVKP